VYLGDQAGKQGRYLIPLPPIFLAKNAFFSSFFFPQSIVAFLKDPKGPPLWEEDPGAKDVVHIDSEKVIFSPSVLVDVGSFPGIWAFQGEEPTELFPQGN
jgi:hypothetical protein